MIIQPEEWTCPEAVKLFHERLDSLFDEQYNIENIEADVNRFCDDLCEALHVQLRAEIELKNCLENKAKQFEESQKLLQEKK